jgi:F-type H+-transporting ATPase subunit a
VSLVAASGPVVHIAPGTNFTVGGLTITNSMLYGWIWITIITALLIWVARRVTIKPQGGLIQYVEAAVEFIRNTVEGAFNDKAIGRKYVPFFVTLFVFILLNNWSELVPVVGDGFQVHQHPAFRPFTGDLNATFAMGLVTMIVVYTGSIRGSGGLGKYLRHFFVGNPLNPGYFFLAMIELFTDLTRVISLSLRLFLNVAIGEILISIMAYLAGQASSFLSPIAAMPFVLLEFAVGALQAYIFTILSTMYMATAVNSAGTHAEHPDLTEDDVPETINSKVNGRSYT